MEKGITKLAIHQMLPLTCSRTGTCCHGKLVFINPWELACIAKGKSITPRHFRDRYCIDGGIRLKFDGEVGWKEQHACSQYVANFGCSVHLGRPLSCRLYPLGRQIQSDLVHYIYEDEEFPCLEGCPEVTQLPYLSVNEYLKGQTTSEFEKAQDEYLIVVQNIADIAFELLLETGLAESGEKQTLQLWRKMGAELPDELTARIGGEWIDYLLFPEIQFNSDNSASFVRKHNELLLLKAQEKFGTVQTNQAFHEASCLMMGVALQLARSIGADPQKLVEHWIEIAKCNGAME